MNILLVAIAGALGTICRYEIGKVISYQDFPVATLLINALGSLFLGFLFVKYAVNQPQLFIAAGIGFCGGFTTYSTFSLDLYKMLVNHQYSYFALYLISSVLLGLVAVFLGAYLAKQM
ncbi:CrcB family protein [Flavobacterium sp. xlx-214]|uniref:fluoride efflux transporter FluC n=1 Tax=unclassified Flavobacterium TaxID=196869 RepID=UPI0013D1F6F8|nr:MULTISPECIES: CrcB family protein [unclassified Flavobacterium]MBA5791431.1 CrcB family protein [Flavobacterium sp. xlx-221]QMI83418.1 CrcB family protein [Flavobacterium sp. xlx-214]